MRWRRRPLSIVRQGSRPSGCPRPMRRGWLRRNRLILPPAPIRLCGRVWLPFRPRQRSSFRQAALYRTHENQSISLVKPRSGGLGLQNAKTARPLLPGAPNGFFLSGYRPCLHGGVSYPTCNPLRHHRSLVRLKRNLRNQPGNTLRTSMGKIVTRYNTGDRHCAYHPVGR